MHNKQRLTALKHVARLTWLGVVSHWLSQKHHSRRGLAQWWEALGGSISMHSWCSFKLEQPYHCWRKDCFCVRKLSWCFLTQPHWNIIVFATNSNDTLKCFLIFRYAVLLPTIPQVKQQVALL